MKSKTIQISYDKNIRQINLLHLKLHSHQIADQPPTNADQFLWLGRVWSGKKLPPLIEERIYPRSTPAVSALYPWCTHAQIPLFPTYTRPTGWPIPALYDQLPTYSWCNYAHYAQYRTNSRSNFHSRPQMNNSSKCNANRQSYLSSVPEMHTWPILLIKSDLKWCIHISILIMKYIMHLFYFGIHFSWPRVEVISGFCVGFPIEVFVWHFEINISTSYKRFKK